MKKSASILVGAGVVLGLHQGRAQVPPAVAQMDAQQQRRQLEAAAPDAATTETAPELYSGEASDVGPQYVLKFRPRRTHFEASADVQYFYTDNMFLNEHDSQGADVLVSTVQFALAPTAYSLGAGQFSPRLGYRHEWYDFGLASGKELQVYDVISGTFSMAHLNEFDFNAQTFFTDGQWRYGNWVVEGGLDYKRLLSTRNYEEFYHEIAPRWGIQRLIPLGANSSLSLGYAGDYRFTQTQLPPAGLGDDFDDRTDHSLYAAYNWAVCRYALIQPYYRFQYTHFTRGEDREDYLHSLGVALYCNLTAHLNLRTFLSYEILDTNSALAQDYNKLDVGGGINLTFRF